MAWIKISYCTVYDEDGVVLKVNQTYVNTVMIIKYRWVLTKQV